MTNQLHLAFKCVTIVAIHTETSTFLDMGMVGVTLRIETNIAKYLKRRKFLCSDYKLALKEFTMVSNEGTLCYCCCVISYKTISEVT